MRKFGRDEVIGINFSVDGGTRQLIGEFANLLTGGNVLKLIRLIVEDWLNDHVDDSGLWQDKYSEVSGCVYIIKSLNGLHKIGFSNDVIRRMLEIEKNRGDDKLELVHTIRTKNTRLTESLLHAKFRDKRIEGEWFDLSADDIEWIIDCPLTKFTWPQL